METSDTLEQQIMSGEKLSVAEATELYNKMISTPDESLKKLYKDKLVLGTLYYVYDYINNNLVSNIKSYSYDLEDIKSSYVQKWIESVLAGKFIKYESFARVLDITFFNNVYKNLIDQKVWTANIKGLSKEKFMYWFMDYASSKLRHIEESDSDYTGDIDPSIAELFDKIFYELELDKYKYIPRKAIADHFELIMESCLFDSINDYQDMEDDNDYIDMAQERVFAEQSAKTILRELQNIIDVRKYTTKRFEIFCKFYGINGYEQKNSIELAKEYGVSRGRISAILVELRDLLFKRSCDDKRRRNYSSDLEKVRKNYYESSI